MRLGQDSGVTRVLHILPHRGGGGETYIDLLAALPGFTHERLPLSAGRSPASAAVSIPLRWPGLALAARRADLVHAHGDVAATLALPLVRAFPSVMTTHGLHFLRRATGARRTAAERSMRLVARSVARVICTSEAERDELAALLGPGLAGRLVVVHNGVAPVAGSADRAEVRAELGLADGDVAALFLGELSERKGVMVAVHAACAVAGEGAPLVLLVAGDGPQAGEVAAAARTSAAIRPLGFRDDPQRLLAAADVFVLPSEREGLSFAVLEAMAHGLAMVVADGAGNPEAVGDAGVVVPAADVSALADALAAVTSDPAQRSALGAAARERALGQFGLERMLAGVAAAYAAALE
jgi:glycosyltransferase involved in cell wall biosynthesis